MKKMCLLLLVITLFSFTLSPTMAFANSAQRYFEGIDANGALVNETECPVEVKSERLTFNIADYPVLREENFDYNSNVIAEYTFYNPADYDVNMQLVFPFGKVPYWIENDYVDIQKYEVYVNDVKVDREIRAIYSEDEKFSLSRDLQKIQDERKSFRHFSDNTPVYKYTVKSTFIHDYDGASTPYARFNCNGRTLFFSGSVSMEYDSSKNVKIYGEEQRTLYSVGGKLSDAFFKPTYCVNIRSEVDGIFKYENKTINGETEYEYLEELTFEDLVFADYSDQSGINRNDYYNAVADKNENRNFTDSATSLDVFDLTNRMLLWYQYDLSIPANATATNKVVAPIYPAFDSSWKPPKYEYTYLLSPASSWASFADLDVIINTEYYLSEESLSGFNKTAENSYTAHFDTLPDRELMFTLCQSDNPEEDNSYSTIFIILFIVLGALVLGAILVVVCAIVIPIVVVCKRKKQPKRTEDFSDYSKTQDAFDDYINNDKEN